MNSLAIIAVLLGLAGEPAQEAAPAVDSTDYTAAATEVSQEDVDSVVQIGDYVVEDPKPQDETPPVQEDIPEQETAEKAPAQPEETEETTAQEDAPQNTEKQPDSEQEAVQANSENVEEPKADTGNPIVTIEMESGEIIVIELYPEYAPNTVANFIYLIETGFYDGLGFHRLVPEFIIQGGDPIGDGTGTPGFTIPGEFSSNGYKDNKLSHTRGTISMARAYEKNSGGSQFFICVEDSVFLDGEYAAFGRVIQGMDVVDKIVTGETDNMDMAVNPRIMKKVTVSYAGDSWVLPKVYMEKTEEAAA